MKLKILLAQPGNVTRFKWELEVLLTNLKELNFPLKDVILLFASPDNKFEAYFENGYGVEAHTYPDNREDKSYIPSIRAYLWIQYLKDDYRREDEDYLYIDSDIIFRELPDIPKGLSSRKWYCADTTGYTSYGYIKSRAYGDELVDKFDEIVGVSEESVKAIDKGMGGAQWIMRCPTLDYWEKVYNDMYAINHYFESIPEKTDANTTDDIKNLIQRWTSEMYSQVWNLSYFGIEPVIDKQLEFTWATDNVDTWYKNKLYHNAGATADNKDLFFKGDYIWKEPYGEDFSYVSPDKASIKYVEAINKVKRA